MPNWPTRTKGGRGFTFTAVFAVVFLGACSPSSDDNWPPEEQADATEQETPAVPSAPQAGDAPYLTEFSREEIGRLQAFSDERRAQLIEENFACQLLGADDLAEVVDGEWTDGVFRWFATEFDRAPAALRGICVWQEVEQRSIISLRVYSASDLAWASLKQFDEQRARRLYERSLVDGPGIGNDAYRIPQGETGVDGSCARLDEHLVCFSAAQQHAEGWDTIDRVLIERVEDALRSTDG